MTPEEARYRASHIRELEERAPVSGELQTLTHAHVARLASALPVHEYLRQLRHVDQLAAELPGTGIGSPRHDAYKARRQLKADNCYAPGLVEACERFLNNHYPAFPDCDVFAVCSDLLEA
jgi:hypothetical protein